MHPLTPADDGILRIAASVVRQSDETSCVATCLALIAAAGDVATALWLSTGADEAAVIDRYDLAAPLAGADAAVPAVRLRALEQSLKHSAVHRGRLRTWPRPFGTPPWGAARVAHFGRTRYGHRLVNDLDTDRAALALAGALSSIRRGFPVILYTGGDSTAGYRNAMPRHAVLLYRSEGAQTQELRIFEPGQGRVHEVSKTSLIRPGAVSAAYGGWPHLTWIVAPRPPG
ncbi:hypothetical protein FB461_0552 [Rarobacter faecitabidus]|uniref:Papain like cysteine protease AvrRpt2 n=2 Tax=Rarobacter faecitabidus TaxID=13243 RepID=A0A542ZUQ2_RARFA|nr:hypothetical protein FB461_0552 [Rarobacter faecitabidus]